MKSSALAGGAADRPQGRKGKTKMYNELIIRIIGATKFNRDNANKADVQRSSFTAGMATALADVLRSMGHSVEMGTWNDNGCDRIGFIKINDAVLVKNSEINYDVYNEILKK